METDVGQMLEQSANRFGDDVATVFATDEGTRERTFAELDTAANRLGNGFLSEHVGYGDAVGLLSPNCPEFVAAFFATQKIGARVTPINVRFDASDVRHVVTDADLDCLVVHRDLVGVVDDLPVADDEVFVVGGHADYRDFGELRDASETNPGVRVGPDAVDGYFYTSGSTGDPKGVVHQHSDRIFVNANVAAEFGLRRSDVNVNPLPLFHSGPLYTGFVPFLQAGVPTVYFPEFDPESTLDAVEAFDATVLGGVPAQYNRLVDAAADGDYDLGSLRFWWVSGAPLTPELRDACHEHLCDRHSIVYGATEIGPPASILQPEESPDYPASCGEGVMGQQIRVVEPSGDPDPEATVPTGETGELAVRGESVMREYLDLPERTAASLVDGWYFTGDLGRRSEDGHLYVEGRKDEMIISGGENVYPSEIEDVLQRHEGVEDAAVVGVAHDEWGQTPKAFVVTRNGADLSGDDLEAFFRESDLADYKRPREVAFVAEIPRNPSGGSVLKDELRSLDE